MTARIVTVTEHVAVAAPDAPGIVRAHRLAAITARPMRGVNGAIGAARGTPEVSFTGPVPTAVQVRHGVVISAPQDIPYMPPAYQDAVAASPTLTGLAALQFARMNR